MTSERRAVKRLGGEAGRRSYPPRSDPEYSHLVRLYDVINREIASHFPNEIEVAVDLGCGSRPYEHLIGAVARKIIGVDLPGNPLADVNMDEGTRVPLRNESADLVVSFQVLEHVSEPEVFLKEIRRILRPGGKLLLSAPGFWPYHPHPCDYRRWLHEGLRLDVERQGFNVLRTIPILRGWSACLQIFLSVLRYTMWRRRNFRWCIKAFSWIASFLIDVLDKYPGKSADLISSTYVVVAKKF